MEEKAEEGKKEKEEEFKLKEEEEDEEEMEVREEVEDKRGAGTNDSIVLRVGGRGGEEGD